MDPVRAGTPGHIARGRSLHLTFMDVGQGDATLVRFPRGTTLLVDAGGLSGAATFDIGDRVVGAVLRHYGIRRLDAAAITHADADHAGGFASVVRDFRPLDVWEGIPVPRSAPLHGVRRAPRPRRQVDEPPGERSVHDRRRRGHRPAPRSVTGNGRTSATTTRSCWSSGGATSRSC
jgi:glyoxylase-like metal-dependent hydrolase (beta-lactamase superfamily II)